MTSQLLAQADASRALRSTPELDPNTVTPGVLGFIVTFLVAAAVVLLAIDMTRRIRRTRYRGEIAERLDAEELGSQIDADYADAARLDPDRVDPDAPDSGLDPRRDGPGDPRRPSD